MGSTYIELDLFFQKVFKLGGPGWDKELLMIWIGKLWAD